MTAPHTFPPQTFGDAGLRLHIIRNFLDRITSDPPAASELYTGESWANAGFTEVRLAVAVYGWRADHNRWLDSDNTMTMVGPPSFQSGNSVLYRLQDRENRVVNARFYNDSVGVFGSPTRPGYTLNLEYLGVLL